MVGAKQCGYGIYKDEGVVKDKSVLCSVSPTAVFARVGVEGPRAPNIAL